MAVSRAYFALSSRGILLAYSLPTASKAGALRASNSTRYALWGAMGRGVAMSGWNPPFRMSGTMPASRMDWPYTLTTMI